jgi:hypothetical protein
VTAEPDLLDDPHRLVAEHVALVHERAERLVQVQVRPADVRGGDPDDASVGSWIVGSGTSVTATLALALPGDCSHVPAPSPPSRD